jgi:hypothetical protein
MNNILKKMREQEQQRISMQALKASVQAPVDSIAKLRQRIKDLYTRLYKLISQSKQRNIERYEDFNMRR